MHQVFASDWRLLASAPTKPLLRSGGFFLVWCRVGGAVGGVAAMCCIVVACCIAVACHIAASCRTAAACRIIVSCRIAVVCRTAATRRNAAA
jgi:hypothetical protein